MWSVAPRTRRSEPAGAAPAARSWRGRGKCQHMRATLDACPGAVGFPGCVRRRRSGRRYPVGGGRCSARGHDIARVGPHRRPWAGCRCLGRNDPGYGGGDGPGGPRKRRRCGKRPSDRRSRGLADHAGHPMPAGEPEADVEREAGEGRRRERGPPSGHYTGVAPRITPGIPDVLTPRRRQCRPGRPGCPGTCVWQTTPTSRQEIASVRDIARGGPIARLSVSTRPDRLAAVPVAISPSVQAGGRQPSRSSR